MSIDKEGNIHFRHDFIKKAWQSIVDPIKYPVKKLSARAKEVYDGWMEDSKKDARSAKHVNEVKELYKVHPEQFM